MPSSPEKRKRSNPLLKRLKTSVLRVLEAQLGAVKLARRFLKELKKLRLRNESEVLGDITILAEAMEDHAEERR